MGLLFFSGKRSSKKIELKPKRMSKLKIALSLAIFGRKKMIVEEKKKKKKLGRGMEVVI